MKTIATQLILTLLLYPILFNHVVYAKETVSAGQAVTLCKNKIAEQYNDQSRSKTSLIKELRSGFKISLRVFFNDETRSINCAVGKDGEVAIVNN